jgi:cytosine/adenosine deaminase-related metal-dependent hydrolase
MRAISADKIFDGREFRSGMVLRTEADGTIIDLIPQAEAGPGVEFFPGILSPGLVNCHCHLELSHMKGRIPEGTGLVDFVSRVVSDRHHPDPEIFSAIEKGEEEMIGNGIVAVGDICNNLMTLPVKKKGRLAYQNFIEASGWLPSVAGARLDRAAALYQEFSATGSSSIVPHAPYSVSKELWEKLIPWFQNKIVSIHNQETAFEDPFFIDGSGDFNRMYQLMGIDNTHHSPTGLSSLQSYYFRLSEAASILLVHNSFTRQEDLDFVRSMKGPASDPYFCLCPNANLYIENSLPPVDLLRNGGFRIVLGTDSLASNHQLDILSEIRTLRSALPHIPLEEMLQWATLNGARALKMDKDLGSFEKGKKPGILVIKEEDLSCRKLV